MGALIVGVCGRSGAGKTSVCQKLCDFGAAFIDTDEVYHGLLEPKNAKPSPLAKKIENVFHGVVLSDGAVDRHSLANIVFSDKGKLELLNKTVHADILFEVDRLISEYTDEGFPIILIDAPAMFESGTDKKCDCLLAVVSDDETAISRICKRDGITGAEAEKRLSSQISDLVLREKCDYIFENNSDVDFETSVKKLFDIFCQRGKNDKG